ncbi:tellurite resistance TerB family protein [Gemmata sp.]|jgi:tellurite resistance protein|uniref:tellurite resistance TerB family protein n=1 Tax=Gemmata sp. TaxID=1914242 RepID=UPI003F6FA4C8
MGLFDMFGGGENKTTFGPHEGFAGVLLAAAAADGHISEEEARGLWGAIERMKLFSSFTPDKFNKLMDTLLKVLKKGGPDALVEKCAPALPERLRGPAFANAVDIVLADGAVEDDEKELIEKLQSALEIDDDEAKMIIQVMIIKNRG